jgi:hypothetical protein
MPEIVWIIKTFMAFSCFTSNAPAYMTEICCGLPNSAMLVYKKLSIFYGFYGYGHLVIYPLDNLYDHLFLYKNEKCILIFY